MDTERTKAFLKSYQRAKRGQLALMLELEELEAAAAFKGTGSDGMPRSRQPQDLSGIAVRLVELKQRIATEALGMVHAFELVDSAISQMGDGYEREVLTRRYILGQKWEEIADEMHMTARHAQRYHGYALSMVRVPEGWKREDRTKA